MRLLNDGPTKTVFLLCNLPLPDARPDHLVRLNDLLLPASLAQVMTRDGAIPCAQRILSSRHPDLFETPEHAKAQVKNWRQNLMVGNTRSTHIAKSTIKSENRQRQEDGRREVSEGYFAIYTPIAFYPSENRPDNILSLRVISYRVAGSRGGKPTIAVLSEGTDPAAALGKFYERPVTILGTATLADHLAGKPHAPPPTPDPVPEPAPAVSPPPPPPEPVPETVAPIPLYARIVRALNAAQSTLSQTEIGIAIGSAGALLGGVLHDMCRRGEIARSGAGFGPVEVAP